MHSYQNIKLNRSHNEMKKIGLIYINKNSKDIKINSTTYSK